MAYYYDSSRWSRLNVDFAANKYTVSTNIGTWVDAVAFDNARVSLDSFYFRSTEAFSSSSTVSFTFDMQIVDNDGELVRSVFSSPSTNSSYNLNQVICKRDIPTSSRLQVKISNASLSAGKMEFTFIVNTDSIDAAVRGLQ
jgi:hypothetical protein